MIKNNLNKNKKHNIIKNIFKINIKKNDNELKILFISDIHSNDDFIKEIIEEIPRINPNLIVLGGDMFEENSTNKYEIIEKFAKTNIQLIFFGGSHEQRLTLEKITQKLQKKYPKVINATDKGNRFIKYKGYYLIFIPGSDVNSGSENYKGGNIKLIFKKKSQKYDKELQEYFIKRKSAKKTGHIYFSDVVNEFRNKSKKEKKFDPLKSIVFSHIPFKCNTKKGIDRAIFSVVEEDIVFLDESKKEFSEMKNSFEKDTILPLDFSKELINYGFPIKIKEANVGNENIKNFLIKNKIKKFICGHIHEAGPKAIDLKERKLMKNREYLESYINNGPAKEGNVTIIVLNNKKIRFNFVNVFKIKK